GRVPAQPRPPRRGRQPQDATLILAAAGAALRPQDRPPAAEALQRPAPRTAADLPRAQRQAGSLVRGGLHQGHVTGGRREKIAAARPRRSAIGPEDPRLPIPDKETPWAFSLWYSSSPQPRRTTCQPSRLRRPGMASPPRYPKPG